MTGSAWHPNQPNYPIPRHGSRGSFPGQVWVDVAFLKGIQTPPSSNGCFITPSSHSSHTYHSTSGSGSGVPNPVVANGSPPGYFS